MELANIEGARGDSPVRFAERLQDAKNLAEETLRAVRDLAMGLRPSMLDDLGLGPALEWQAREFSRRMGVPVDLRIDGSIEHLQDEHRTCVFRIVQESLNNCAKHAHPKNIRILVHGSSDRVNLTVQDDGVGFDREAGGGTGLGLISIEERVRELDGTVTLTSQPPNRGTLLRVEIPLEPRPVHG
jgi:signal transduction histidine kinase